MWSSALLLPLLCWIAPQTSASYINPVVMASSHGSGMGGSGSMSVDHGSGMGELGSGHLPPPGCAGDYTIINKAGLSPTCIKVYNETLNWMDAYETCEKDNAYLVEPHSKLINRFIAKHLDRGKRYWTGIEKVVETWMYSHAKRPVREFNWAAKEPNNHRNKEGCVEIIGNKRGRWNDKRCSKKRRFVCEHPAFMALAR